jgi:type I restriction enzyme R subunit
MPSNFDFLREHRPELHPEAVEAERLVRSAPRASCFHARFCLEQAVHWLFRHDPTLHPPTEARLGALLHEPSLQSSLPPAVFEQARAVLKAGNAAAHDERRPSADLALRTLRALHGVLFWVSVSYTRRPDHPDVRFDAALVPPPPAPPPSTDGAGAPAPAPRPPDAAALATLHADLSAKDALLAHREATLSAFAAQTDAELTALRAELAALKARNAAAARPHDYGEAETRRLLLDLLLLEAGWDVDVPTLVGREVEVRGLPTASGMGFVDYVLWGPDGRPLALVEAKRSLASATAGEQQAKLYADCLEAKYGRRPVLFLSNGYQHWIWDDARYPRRPIQGFLKRGELERLHHRRTKAAPLGEAVPDAQVAGRAYQNEAIRRVCEAFTKRQRHALLVMATGTGKTRVAVALVELLRRCNWVERVLFLADRNALVTQALRAFRQHLPYVTAIDLSEAPGPPGLGPMDATFVAATYPAMFHRIDEMAGRPAGPGSARAGEGGGERAFGPGHFDLVIVDEAHRSTYQRYRAIFEYFDALMVGLTATPRAELDRDTFEIFRLEQGNPTFAYELDQAVADRTLVPPRGVEVPFKFLREGVTYAELPPDEQAEYEAKLFDEETGALPAGVSPSALNEWLFNEDTADRALAFVMQHGLKVAGGDRLGKTILFARSSAHADFLKARFDARWPESAGRVARVIDSRDRFAQSLLDEFADPKSDFALALSVDMLDTGVDIPEVVNLVFFKPLQSKVKFRQMVGRGTRLCEDLFGPGQHKTHFLVFDLCGNFAFFGQKLPVVDDPPPDSLTARLVKTRLRLVECLEARTHQDDAGATLRAELLDELHRHVTAMNDESFVVRAELEEVHRFRTRARWEALDDHDREIVRRRLAGLPTTLPLEPQETKEFDLLCLKLQVALLTGSKIFVALAKQVRELMQALAEKENVPMVRAHLALITHVADESWWADVTFVELEDVRQKLRALIPLIDKHARRKVYTDFEDTLLLPPDALVLEDSAVVPVWADDSLALYRERVERHIRRHQDHTAVAKLRRARPLTPTDLEALEALVFAPEAGESKECFQERIGVPLPRFIRSLVGLDRGAAKEAFAEFLARDTLTAAQLRFIDQIIDGLTHEGAMDPRLLYEPPFTGIHEQGLDGVFGDADADKVVAIVRRVSAVCEPASAADGEAA